MSTSKKTQDANGQRQRLKLQYIENEPDSYGNIDNNRLDFPRVIGALFSRFWLILGITLIGGEIAFFASSLRDPEFNARATVVLQSENLAAGLINVQGQSEINRATVETQMDVIKSRELMGHVVDRMDLTHDLRFFADQGSEFDDFARYETAVTRLTTAVRVSRKGESLALFISATASDATLVADIANGVANEYISQRFVARQDEIQLAVGVLRDRATALTQKLATGERLLAEHIRTTNLDDASIDLRLRSELSRLETRLDIANNNLESDTTEFEKQIAEIQQELLDRTLAVIRQEELDRELATDRSRYIQVVDQLSLLDSETDTIRNAALLVSPARPPLGQSSMSIKAATVLGLLGGGFLAVMLTFFLATFDRGIRRTEQLEALLKKPCLATIPIVPRKGFSRKQILPHKYFLENPRSAFSDSIRRLLYNLAAQIDHEGCAVVAITSSLPNEGKSSTSTCLSIAASVNKQRIALVDFDMRRSGIDNFVNRDGQEKQSLMKWFTGDAKLEDIVVKLNDFDGVDLYTWPTSMDNYSFEVNDSRLVKLFSELRKKYDLVIVDTPPIMLVSEVTLLTRHVDGFLVIAQWGGVSERILMDLSKTLAMSGGIIIGSVLSQVNPKKQHHYGAGGYLYNYQYGKGYE